MKRIYSTLDDLNPGFFYISNVLSGTIHSYVDSSQSFSSSHALIAL